MVNSDNLQIRPLFDVRTLIERGVISPLQGGMSLPQEIGLPQMDPWSFALAPRAPQGRPTTVDTSAFDDTLDQLRGEQAGYKQQIESAASQRQQLTPPQYEKAKPIKQGQFNTGLLVGALARLAGASDRAVQGAAQAYWGGLQQRNQQAAEFNNQQKALAYNDTLAKLNSQMESSRLLYGMASDEIDATTKALNKFRDDANAILLNKTKQAGSAMEKIIEFSNKGTLTTTDLTLLGDIVASNGGEIDPDKWESLYAQARENEKRIGDTQDLEKIKALNDITRQEQAIRASDQDFEIRNIEQEIKGYDRDIKAYEADPENLELKRRADEARTATLESNAKIAAIRASFEERNQNAKLARTWQLIEKGWNDLREAGTKTDTQGIENDIKHYFTERRNKREASVTVAGTDPNASQNYKKISDGFRDAAIRRIFQIQDEGKRNKYIQEGLARDIFTQGDIDKYNSGFRSIWRKVKQVGK